MFNYSHTFIYLFFSPIFKNPIHSNYIFKYGLSGIMHTYDIYIMQTKLGRSILQVLLSKHSYICKHSKQNYSV